MHSGSAWTSMSIGILRPTFPRHASEGIPHAFFVARKTNLALVSYHVAILGSAGSGLLNFMSFCA